ncbi:hypothetical protein J6590_096603 [Homalodisca vitripennis]|nr:hypothetical protein J6590_096603 [Homalodisca vitripennis]
MSNNRKSCTAAEALKEKSIQSVSFDTSRDQHNVTAGTSGVLDGPAIVAVNARHCPLYSASSSPSPSDSPAILSRQLSSLVTLRELRRVLFLS